MYVAEVRLDYIYHFIAGYLGALPEMEKKSSETFRSNDLCSDG